MRTSLRNIRNSLQKYFAVQFVICKIRCSLYQFKFKSDKCDRYFSGNSVVMWCEKCKNAYCLACTIVHETWQELKSHNKVITASWGILASPKSIKTLCGVQAKPFQPLGIYCNACGIVVCHSCSTTKKHHNHQFLTIMMKGSQKSKRSCKALLFQWNSCWIK